MGAFRRGFEPRGQIDLIARRSSNILRGLKLHVRVTCLLGPQDLAGLFQTFGVTRQLTSTLHDAAATVSYAQAPAPKTAWAANTAAMEDILFHFVLCHSPLLET